MNNKYLTSALLSVSLMAAMAPATPSLAITPTIPHELIYEGRMLSKTNLPLSGSYTMRFSLWDNTDIIASHIDANGAINTSSLQYGDWTEELPVTFTDQGYFSVILGTQSSLLDVDLAKHKYLQVEIKKSSDLDTEYQTLDVDLSDDTLDRKRIASLPYAYNAKESTIAQSSSGASSNVFMLDPEDLIQTAGTGNVTLQFGNTLGKALSYDFDRSIFTFNDSVEVQGDLTIRSDTGSASFSADSLTGDRVYDLPDSDTELVGTDTAQTLTNKTIDASVNTITNIDASNLLPSLKTQIITPLYPNMTFEANGANKMVSVFMGADTENQYYKISTDETALQEGIFFIDIPLEEFVDLSTAALHYTMKTTSGSTANGNVSVRVESSSGTVLATDSMQTTSGGWETKTIDLSGLTLPDGMIRLTITTQATDGNPVFISNIKTEYQGK